MKLDKGSKLIVVLVGILTVVVLVQSALMAKLYGQICSDRGAEQEQATPVEIRPKPVAAASRSPRPQTSVLRPAGLPPASWDPFSEFRQLRQQMDQIFNDSFGRFQTLPDFETLWDGTTFSPRVDVEEQAESYIVRMDIPGVEKADISVEIEDRLLGVTGKIDEVVEEQDDRMLRKERRSGRFERSVLLPGSVDAEAMSAEYTDGVLTVTVPKGEEGGGSKTVTIQ